MVRKSGKEFFNKKCSNFFSDVAQLSAEQSQC